MEPTKNTLVWNGMFCSPTALNALIACPRYFYYRYIEGRIPPLTNHIIKGVTLHSVLENFWEKYESKLGKRMYKYLDYWWENYAIPEFEKLGTYTEEDINNEKKDCINILRNYLFKTANNIKMLVEAGKAENRRHAFFLLKPIMTETWYEDPSIKACGKIDYVQKDFDGNLIIGDYKTSKKPIFYLKPDYYRAMILYALLVYRVDGIIPHWLAINYIRYGDTDRFKYTPEMAKEALDLVKWFHERTKSNKIEDYPKTSKTWKCGGKNYKCDFYDLCSGNKETDKEINKNQLKNKFLN